VARSSLIRSCFVALILVGMTTLGACTTDSHQLPSVSDSNSEKSASLEAVAKAYSDCMTDAGIEVELFSNSDGELAIVQVSSKHTVLQRNQNGASMTIAPDDSSLSRQVTDDFLSDRSTEPALIIDGIDHTDTYVQCLDVSGYDDQVAQGSGPRVDLAYMERLVRANNKWAACARENGWPSVKDSVMPTVVDGAEQPEVLLPITITEDQLRQLLDACPNFDAEQMKRMDDWWRTNPQATGYPDDYLPDPSIAFEWSTDADQETLDGIPSLNAHLHEILNEKAAEYNQSVTPR